MDDLLQILVGGGLGMMLFNCNDFECVMQMLLLGVVIFVYGVNLEGEWFQEVEKGLCVGLNWCMGCYDDQLFYWGLVVGQMMLVSYIESLMLDGFLNLEMLLKMYIKFDLFFLFVIYFWWGYVVNVQELKEYGDKIMFNEKNYWGGGLFVGGCLSLLDLWNDGLNDWFFLWLIVQYMNSIGN